MAGMNHQLTTYMGGRRLRLYSIPTQHVPDRLRAGWIVAFSAAKWVKYVQYVKWKS